MIVFKYNRFEKIKSKIQHIQKVSQHHVEGLTQAPPSHVDAKKPHPSSSQECHKFV